GSLLEHPEAQKATSSRYNARNAHEFDADEYDFVIVHDPQPAGLIEHVPRTGARWIWRCHIDLSQPNEAVLGFLAPALSRYHATIFHRAAYVPRIDGRLPAA